MSAEARPGAVLMSYGSPASLDTEGVGAYLARVRGGRTPDSDLVGEFTRRYQVIRGSPLIPITQAQAARLGERLGWPAVAGMRFSEPSIETALRVLADQGVGRVAAIILSPQYSPMLMGGYGRDIEMARAAIGPGAPGVVVAGAWHEEPAFVGALAGRVRADLARRGRDDRATTHVLMTAHSLPRPVADKEPEYLAQLRWTAEAVAAEAGLAADRWAFCWQSAGHEPGEWMTPDFADLMPGIAAAGGRSVLVVPIQFLADHLETLYDVDIGAREQAEAVGLDFRRVAALGSDRDLVDVLATVARRTLNSVGA